MDSQVLVSGHVETNPADGRTAGGQSKHFCSLPYQACRNLGSAGCIFQIKIVNRFTQLIQPAAVIGHILLVKQPLVDNHFDHGGQKGRIFSWLYLKEEIGLPGHVAVYVPQAYNIGGNVIVVPAERVTRLDAEPAAVMTFVVSGGVAGEVAPGNDRG